MSASVLLFASAKELAGSPTVELNVSLPATVAELKCELLKHVPRLNSVSASLLWAVNSQYATAETVVVSGDTVACFPPVSGG